jgi:hypothetical protein
MRSRMAGMKRKHVVSAMLAIIVSVLLVAVYFAAYFALPERLDAAGQRSRVHLRIFKARWQAALFTPAAKIESLTTGQNVVTESPGDSNPFL